MTKINQDIPTSSNDRYVAGDTAILNDTVESADGTSKNLTGATVTFALSERPGSPPLFQKDTSGGGVAITDGVNGEIEVTIDPSDTEELGAIDGREYYYEVEVVDSSGDIATVTTGEWTIWSDTA